MKDTINKALVIYYRVVRCTLIIMIGDYILN